MPRARRSLLLSDLMCLFYFLLFLIFPGFLLLFNGTRLTLGTAFGINAGILQTILLLTGIAMIALTLLKDQTKRGSRLNLISGIVFYTLWLALFLYLGSINAPAPRLGTTTLTPTIRGNNFNITLNYSGILLLWILFGILRVTARLINFTTTPTLTILQR